MTQDIIERHADAILSAAGSALRHYSMHKTRSDIFAAVEVAMNHNTTEVEQLRAENERLREALNYYAANHAWPNEGPWGVDSNDFGNVARAALAAQQKDVE